MLGSASVLALGLLTAGSVSPASAAAATWMQLTPTSSPPPVRNGAMTYDSAIGKVVQFGGEINSSTYLKTDQTWTYDGTTWTNVTPDPVTATNNPSARASATMVYAAALGKVVLFGGRAEGIGGYANDTWTYDGTTWTRVIANGDVASPPGRQEAMMAYDANIGKVVLFGGIGNGTVRLDDTWTFDGTSWTDVSGTSRPPARTSGAMAYDPNTSSVILFGGSGTSGYLADTWSWNAGTWTELLPGTSPAARGYSQLAYDPGTGRLLLYGGYNDADFADTWSFDATANTGNGAWTQLTPSANPGARSSFTMAFDGARSQLILFGGWSFGGQTLLGDTWAYAVPPVNPPDAPAAPIAVPGNAQVALSWTAPADGGSPITGYTVSYKPTAGSSWTTQAVTAPTTSATVSGLTNGTGYDFKVRAVNDIGAGDYSAVTSATPSTVPSTPTGLDAVAADRQVALTWTAPFDGGSAITGYTVAYKAADARKWTTTTSTDTSATISGLLNGTQYAFKVLASNVNGNSAYTAEVGATPYSPNVPGEPYGLNAEPVPGVRTMDVVLTWTDTDTNATDHLVTVYSYRLSKGVPTYREVDAIQTGNGSNTFTVPGLSPRKAYAFTVSAGNEYGWSGPSGYALLPPG